jgi:hypothetical protein
MSMRSSRQRESRSSQPMFDKESSPKRTASR